MYLFHFLHICAHMPSFLTLCEHTYIGGIPLPSLRGFEHLSASYLITPFHQHRQALRCIRYLHGHPLARSHQTQPWNWCHTCQTFPSPCNVSLLTRSHPMNRHFVVCLLSTRFASYSVLSAPACVCFVSWFIHSFALSPQYVAFTELLSQVVVENSIAKEEFNVR